MLNYDTKNVSMCYVISSHNILLKINCSKCLSVLNGMFEWVIIYRFTSNKLSGLLICFNGGVDGLLFYTHKMIVC